MSGEIQPKNYGEFKLAEYPIQYNDMENPKWQNIQSSMNPVCRVKSSIERWSRLRRERRSPHADTLVPTRSTPSQTIRHRRRYGPHSLALLPGNCPYMDLCPSAGHMRRKRSRIITVQTHILARLPHHGDSRTKIHGKAPGSPSHRPTRICDSPIMAIQRDGGDQEGKEGFQSPPIGHLNPNLVNPLIRPSGTAGGMDHIR